MSRAAELYLLDEPLGGVDPAARDYILQHHHRTTTARMPRLFCPPTSSATLRRCWTRSFFLQDGKVLRQTAVDELREETGKSVDAYFREVYKC